MSIRCSEEMHAVAEFLVDVDHKRAAIQQRPCGDHFFTAAALCWNAVPDGLEKRRGLSNLKRRQRGQLGDREDAIRGGSFEFGPRDEPGWDRVQSVEELQRRGWIVETVPERSALDLQLTQERAGRAAGEGWSEVQIVEQVEVCGHAVR